MSNHDIPNGTLVVVATGAHAKFFKARAKGDGLSLEAAGGLEPQNLDDEGPSGKRPPESSIRETDEATFAKQLAQNLYDRVHNHQDMTLVLVMDPDTLGELRPVLHKEVASKVILELPKTLTGQSAEDIATIVAKSSQA